MYTLNRFHAHFKQNICLDMLIKQNITSILQIPKLKKIILNTSSKVIINDKKYILPGLVALELLSAQKLKYTSAHKSIAGFKLRKNQIVGCKVTLRGKTMYNFLEKLITIILPRVRNFDGGHLSSLDQNGNYNLGISQILTFPELENHFEYFDSIRGVNITLVTTNKIDEKTNLKNFLLLSGFQFPVK